MAISQRHCHVSAADDCGNEHGYLAAFSVAQHIQTVQPGALARALHEANLRDVDPSGPRSLRGLKRQGLPEVLPPQPTSVAMSEGPSGARSCRKSLQRRTRPAAESLMEHTSARTSTVTDSRVPGRAPGRGACVHDHGPKAENMSKHWHAARRLGTKARGTSQKIQVSTNFSILF